MGKSRTSSNKKRDAASLSPSPPRYQKKSKSGYQQEHNHQRNKRISKTQDDDASDVLRHKSSKVDKNMSKSQARARNASEDDDSNDDSPGRNKPISRSRSPYKSKYDDDDEAYQVSGGEDSNTQASDCNDNEEEDDDEDNSPNDEDNNHNDEDSSSEGGKNDEDDKQTKTTEKLSHSSTKERQQPSVATNQDANDLPETLKKIKLFSHQEVAHLWRTTKDLRQKNAQITLDAVIQSVCRLQQWQDEEEDELSFTLTRIWNHEENVAKAEKRLRDRNDTQEILLQVKHSLQAHIDKITKGQHVFKNLYNLDRLTTAEKVQLAKDVFTEEGIKIVESDDDNAEGKLVKLLQKGWPTLKFAIMGKQQQHTSGISQTQRQPGIKINQR